MLKQDIEAVWETMETSIYSDEIMHGLVVSQVVSLKEKIPMLKHMADELRNVSSNIPKEVNKSVEELGIGGSEHIGGLVT